MAGRSGGIRFISDREGSVKGRDASRTPVSGPGANRAGRTGTGAVYIFFNSHFAMHDRIKNACRSAGFVPRIVSESSQWDLIREMVRADLGIAFLPGTICRLLDPNKVKAISLVSPEIPWQPVMAWRREGYQSLAAREWIAFTKQIFAEPT